ncbi:MAG: sulfatase-like hydrolase/transferase, partial [Candidatus Hydrogenedentota bacterium]
PAILTGNYPPSSAVLPLYQNYPQSLFNILSNEYAIHALEQATSLAPSDPQRKHWRQNNATLTLFAGDLAVIYLNTVLPESLAKKWFPIDEGLWGGFLSQSESPDKKARLKYGEPERARGWRMDRMGDWARAERLEPIDQYISAIDDFPNQTFHFMHILLPHYPFQHLPSGRLYNFDQWPVPSNHTPNALPDSQPYIDQRRHAHLLQVGLVDTILGRLTQTLKTNTLYDESLIVLVADHGIAFKEGVDGRILSTENIASVGFVPLFIKYPHQKSGTIDSSNAQTIDIAPTILDVLKAGNTAPTDGRSLLDKNFIPVIKKLTNRHGTVFEYKESEYLELRSSEHNDYIQHFPLDNPNATLYQRGPGLNYLELSIDALKDIAITAVIECPGLQDLSSIDPQTNYIPLLLTGTVSCPTENSPENLIVALTINGAVKAVTQPFDAQNSMLFTMLVSENDLLRSNNDFKIFLLPSHNDSP